MQGKRRYRKKKDSGRDAEREIGERLGESGGDREIERDKIVGDTERDRLGDDGE